VPLVPAESIFGRHFAFERTPMSEIGVYRFGDLSAGAHGPQAVQQRAREIIATARFVDEAGAHFFGVGEHHRSH